MKRGPGNANGSGKTAEAEQRYTQAIQIYRTEGANLGLANSLKSLGDVETETGNSQVAHSHGHFWPGSCWRGAN